MSFYPFHVKVIWFARNEMHDTFLEYQKKILFYWLLIYQNSCKGAFTNYVDKILLISDHLPTSYWHLCRNSFTGMRENLHKVDISSTNLVRLVNVVCEYPLMQLQGFSNSYTYVYVEQTDR